MKHIDLKGESYVIVSTGINPSQEAGVQQLANREGMAATMRHHSSRGMPHQECAESPMPCTCIGLR